MATQQIRRDYARLAVVLAVAAGCALIAVWAFVSIAGGFVRWGLTIVSGLAALLVFGYGAGATGIVACSSCGKTIKGVNPTRNPAVLCPHCLEFSTGDRGTLDVTPEGYVADAPVFGADLPSRLAWPPGCCACEQAATRMLESKLVDDRPGAAERDLAVGIASLGVLKAVQRTTYTISAPHCAQHEHGVALVFGVPTGTGYPPATLAFRSYAYYRKFRMLNTMPPRRLF